LDKLVRYSFSDTAAAMADDSEMLKTHIDDLFERFAVVAPFAQRDETAWQQFARGAPITFTSHNYQVLLRKCEALAVEFADEKERTAQCEATTTQLRRRLDNAAAEWHDERQQLEELVAVAQREAVHLEELLCAATARGDEAHTAVEALTCAMQLRHSAQLAELHMSYEAESLRQLEQHKKKASYAETAAQIRAENLVEEHSRQLEEQQQAHDIQLKKRTAPHQVATAQLRRQLAAKEQLLCTVAADKDASIAKFEHQIEELQGERTRFAAEAVSYLPHPLACETVPSCTIVQ
jgi:chromosome segregation ATPase